MDKFPLKRINIYLFIKMISLRLTHAKGDFSTMYHYLLADANKRPAVSPREIELTS